MFGPDVLVAPITAHGRAGARRVSARRERRGWTRGPGSPCGESGWVTADGAARAYSGLPSGGRRADGPLGRADRTGVARRAHRASTDEHEDSGPTSAGRRVRGSAEAARRRGPSRGCPHAEAAARGLALPRAGDRVSAVRVRPADRLQRDVELRADARPRRSSDFTAPCAGLANYRFILDDPTSRAAIFRTLEFTVGSLARAVHHRLCSRACCSASRSRAGHLPAR